MLLDEVRDGPLHTADDAAVHHDRTVLRPVRADVVQIEPFRLVEVDLDGRQGRLPARRVGDLDVDLRPVERGLALDRLVRQPGGVEDIGQQGGGALPHLRRGDVLSARARQREPEAGRPDAERPVRPADHVQRGPRLVADLVRGAEDVGVVQLDGPHPGQPAEHPGELGAVHAAQLGHPQRQFAVTVRAGAVDDRVVRAQTRPQDDLFAAQVHRREHVVAVVRPVPRDLVQLPLAEHR